MNLKEKLNWESIYNDYYKSVGKMIGSILGYNHIYFDDLISQTFEKGMEMEHQFDSSKANINTWLCTIAKNLAYKQYTKGKRQTEVSEHIKQDESDYIDIEQQHKRLLHIIGSLPNGTNKDTFLLHAAGKSTKYIAELKGIAEVSVRGQIKRFSDQIREIASKELIFAEYSKTGDKYGYFKAKQNKLTLKKIYKIK